MVLALVYTALLWFFSTGAILWLNRLPRETHPGCITAATPLAGAAVCGLIVSSGDTGAAAAYFAFTSALVIWGWHEMSFLMGFVRGPRRTPCPEGATGWRRFAAATGTLIYHELALAATLGIIVLISWGQPNQTGTLTFALLFVMRLSAKFNIYFGVPNLSADMMPEHLGYLKSYFRVRRFNGLFPLSVVCGSALALWLFDAARASGQIGYALLFAMTLLAMIEHILMFLPVRDSELWKWAQPSGMFGTKHERMGRS